MGDLGVLADGGIVGVCIALIWLVSLLVKNAEAREERLVQAMCANTAVLEAIKVLINERLRVVGGGR